MTHAEIVAAKGTRAIAEATKAERATVRVWKNRNTIPRWAYAYLMVAFPDLTLEKLEKGAKA